MSNARHMKAPPASEEPPVPRARGTEPSQPESLHPDPITELSSARRVLAPDASRQEWLNTRLQGLGGSDVAAAVGLNPWTTPYQLWLDKTGRLDPDHGDDSQRRMRWGNILEPVVLSEFADAHPEYRIAAGVGTFADITLPWRLANPDGIGAHRDGQPAAVIEIKTGNHRQLPHWGTDDEPNVPDHYTCQVQWYLSVLDLPGAHVAALLDTSTYIERDVDRDDELVELLTERAADFWQHVQADTPPPVDNSDRTKRALSQRAAEPGIVIDLGSAWTDKIAEYARLGEVAKSIESARNQIANEVRAELGDAERGEINGTKVVTFAAPKPRASCDLERLAEQHPEAYADCVTAKPQGRRLTITNPKEHTDG